MIYILEFHPSEGHQIRPIYLIIVSVMLTLISLVRVRRRSCLLDVKSQVYPIVSRAQAGLSMCEWVLSMLQAESKQHTKGQPSCSHLWVPSSPDSPRAMRRSVCSGELRKCLLKEGYGSGFEEKLVSSEWSNMYWRINQ